MDPINYYNFQPPVTFSSNEMIDNIKEQDSTISFIGYIDEISDIEIGGKQKDKKIFRFIVNNQDGHRIQVKVWGENLIKKILPSIKSNEIVHLDGVAAKPVKVAKFNNGTTKFEFCIQTNTEIHCLGKHLISQTINKNMKPLCPIEEVGNTTEAIRIEGYIKTVFEKVFHDQSGKYLYLSGSITDGVYKLETRIQMINQELSLQKGEKVELTGMMKYGGSISYFDVMSTNDVVKKEEKGMDLKTIFTACKKIKRAFPSSNENNDAKQQKLG